MVSEPKKALEVFFSYSHKDQDLRDQLETHLSLLKNQGLFLAGTTVKLSLGQNGLEKLMHI